MTRFACAVFLALLPAATALGQERYFHSAGVRIHYLDQGAGPAVMLIHGFTASIESSWIDTGVLPDLARAPRAYDELGLDVIRLLDHLGIERAHVVGYSLGGIVVAKLLTTHPERFVTAVLVGGADPAAPRVRAMRARWPGLEVDVVAGATHPTVHPRGLLRRPEFRAAIRRHVAR
jgi:pimeloyl-ACP methyl ester carboxylesterase